MWRALLAIVFAAGQTLGPAALPPTTDQRFEVFGNYLESLRAQAGIPGLTAGAIADDVVWERAFGFQDVDRLIVPRTITPFHVDGLTQLFTATLVLRCIEEGRLSLTDRLGQFDPDSPNAALTIEQALSHTTGSPGKLAFNYRLSTLAPLAAAVQSCTNRPFRVAMAQLFDQLAMTDSVPGPDVVTLPPPVEGIDANTVARYKAALERMAIPYATRSGRPVPSKGAEFLTPTAGVVTTIRDFAKFDAALRKGNIIRPQTLAAAWTLPSDRFGQQQPVLPHAIGWFVQMYNGEKIAWQFGVGDNASSSLVVTSPGRNFTIVLMANSEGLVNPFAVASGDLSASPFGRLVLGTFFP